MVHTKAAVPQAPFGPAPGAPGLTPDFPLIEVEGDPRDIGLGYGRAAGDRIHRCVAIYRAALDDNGLDWEQARRIAALFLPKIEAYAPRFAAEIAGIAQGAGLPVEDVVALNARTELLYGFKLGRSGDDSPIRRPPSRTNPREAADGCTGVIALPGATANGHTIHAQNWDWRDVCADVGVVLRMRPRDRPAMLCFVEAGQLARAGFNDRGVAITGNYLECDQDGQHLGIPIPLIRRRVLEADDLAIAVAEVSQAKRGFSNNMMLSQSDGEAFDLETTPEQVFWIAPERDLLVHANHFVSPAARARVRDLHVLEAPDTLYRDIRVRRALDAAHGTITVETVKTALQDKYASPRAVCRSPADGPGGSSSSTVATIVMDTTERRMWVAPRPYGPHRFTEYRLDA